MWSLDRYLLADFAIKDGVMRNIAMVPFAACMLLLLLVIENFMKHRTTVDPSKSNKATSLEQTGIYRYTRNPMYLAMLFMLLAIAIKIGNPFGLPVLVLFT